MKKLFAFILATFLVVSLFGQTTNNRQVPFHVSDSVTLFNASLIDGTLVFDEGSNKLWRLDQLGTGGLSLSTVSKTLIAQFGGVASPLSVVLGIGNTSSGNDILMGADSIEFGSTDLVKMYEDGAGSFMLLNNSGASSNIALQNQNGSTLGTFSMGLVQGIFEQTGVLDAGKIKLNFGVTDPSVILESDNASGGFKHELISTTPTADRTATLQDASGTIAYLTDIPAANNIYSNDGTITGTRTVTMGTNNLMFNSTGLADLFHIDAVNDRIGIGVTPLYGFHTNNGNAFIQGGNMAIGGTPPDASHKFRVSTDNADGNNFIGARIDNGYDAATGNFSGLMVRSTNVKTGGSSNLIGVNSFLSGDVSAGNHEFIGGRFGVTTTQSGTGTITKYAIQLQDGTEGTVNHVWTSVTTDGKGHWADPNTLISAGTGGIYGGNGSLGGNTSVTMGGNNLVFLPAGGQIGFGTSTPQANNLLDVEVPIGDNPMSFYENRVGGASIGDVMTTAWYYNNTSPARVSGNVNIESRVETVDATNVRTSLTLGQTLKVSQPTGTNGGTVLIHPAATTQPSQAFLDVRQTAASGFNTALQVVSKGNTASQQVAWFKNLAGQTMWRIDGTGKSFFNVNNLGTADLQYEGLTDPNLLFIDASLNRIGVGASFANAKLTVKGTTDETQFAVYGNTTSQGNPLTAWFDNTGTNVLNIGNDGKISRTNGDIRIGPVGASGNVRLTTWGGGTFAFFDMDSTDPKLGLGTSTPNASAILDLTSTDKGLLFPRLTATQASAVTGVNGLMIYVTNTNGTFTAIGFWGYVNGTWTQM